MDEATMRQLRDTVFLRTDKYFNMPFSKARKYDTIFLEESENNSDKYQGKLIDIFPLDKVKRTYGMQRLLVFLIYRIL